jgi:hypothetical protein
MKTKIISIFNGGNKCMKNRIHYNNKSSDRMCFLNYFEINLEEFLIKSVSAKEISEMSDIDIDLHCFNLKNEENSKDKSIKIGMKQDYGYNCDRSFIGCIETNWDEFLVKVFSTEEDSERLSIGMDLHSNECNSSEGKTIKSEIGQDYNNKGGIYLLNQIEFNWDELMVKPVTELRYFLNKRKIYKTSFS